MEDNLYYQQRLEKLQKLKEEGLNPFPNDLSCTHTSGEILQNHSGLSKEELEAKKIEVRLAGRIMFQRSFGKACFVKLKDRDGRIQAYVKKDAVSEADWALFERAEVGDFLWVEGYLFRTKTDELSIHVEKLRLAVKSLQQLPEKFHGLTDIEARYRQRYVDLIMNDEVKDVFLKRSLVIQKIRQFLVERRFVEVETPMMQPIPGGAAAKPFVTHHNALDMKLYLRIAPELYLKRLVVGGIERVFEINRNFRNEGISIQHNPEFTMLEFYQAYATYEDLIALTEEMLARLALEVCGSTEISYQGAALSFQKPFRRLTLKEALVQIGGFDPAILTSRDKALAEAKRLEIHLKKEKEGLGAILTELFEEKVEKQLIQPTFITQYPTEVSPLSRRNEADPEVTDRFELFIYGREIANGFSELNDPLDQKERFLKQVAAREAGDEEAMYLDQDFITALEYGMPPTAGEGIGIDRLVMLLTDQASIRDVILFPHMRAKG
ncbi:lysine--tRNA ligase [Deltaproteobacteria bacterium PRO3]|nr:lysine--tRNA ligase [Deltaproteobacteria bacterium PRO3]